MAGGFLTLVRCRCGSDLNCRRNRRHDDVRALLFSSGFSHDLARRSCLKLVFLMPIFGCKRRALKTLIKSHKSRDDSHFYSVAMQGAAQEAKQGHGRLAEELLNLLDKAKAILANDNRGKLVPFANVAKNRTNLKPW
ncbi:hypothetical protein ACVGWG_13375 [Enterobacter asburiae]|nr:MULTISPECIES: hypothetical protein [Enterobacteriaceae]MDH0518364.1 hypothetical protein [Enterobacter roggenkampii]WIJ51985.1 hypothetical protein OI984_25350 [Enterobacter roggenkampii]WIJ81663.1 hypothetical protein OI980_26755 [Enterobacter roggenkampii]VAC43728.1 Uncharacterised protein [Enterobacter hormaechei]